jgi:hypothetical protein
MSLAFDHVFCLVDDLDEAARNRLRLDRRADWRVTGASPIGIGLRGPLRLDSREEFWLYDKLGVRIWVHHDNELAPQRPLVIALELTAEQLEQRKPRSAAARATAQPLMRAIRGLQITGPGRARLPPYAGPQITHALGSFYLHIDAGPGPTRSITDTLAITRLAPRHPKESQDADVAKRSGPQAGR